MREIFIGCCLRCGMIEYGKVNAVATCVIGFTTFLGVLGALIYYLYQIRDTNFFEVFAFGMFYIDLNLAFLYYLRRKGVF